MGHLKIMLGGTISFKWYPSTSVKESVFRVRVLK